MIKSFAALYLCFLTGFSWGQTVEKSGFSVFTPVSENDSLLILGGQILSGTMPDEQVLHGYYPLQRSFLSIPVLSLPSLTIFPNPVKETLYITVSDQPTVFDVQLVDQTGKLIRNYANSSVQAGVDVSDLAVGMYFIPLTLPDGKVATYKFIKA